MVFSMIRIGRQKGSVCASLALLPALGYSLTVQTRVMAQVVSEGASPTTIETVGDRIDITGGDLSADNTNLFHNFEQFDITSEQTANFITTAEIENVIAGINSEQSSVIDGMLQVSGSDANLYLVNPAGILLGPDAQLNLSGGFTATTATGVGFDEASFNAAGSNSYAQLNGSPTHFQFDNPYSANLVNLGNLAVKENQSLSLIGGTVVNSGQLQAPSGNITVTAVEEEHTVRINQAGWLLSLEIEPSDLAQPSQTVLPTQLGGMLTGSGLNHATRLEVQPDGSVLLEGSSVEEKGGDAYIAGGLSTVGEQRGGEISVLGDRILLTNATLDASGNEQSGLIRVGGGTRGQENFTTATTTLVDASSALVADAAEMGNGGRIVVWGDEQTDFLGSVSAQGGELGGDGGFLEVSGKRSLLFGGSVDLSASEGSFGTLLLDPENVEITDGTIEDETATYLSSTAVEALFNTTNLIIEASNDIYIHDLIGDQLTTQVGRDVTFVADSDNSNSGSFKMDSDITLFAEQGEVSIFGAGVTVGHINTSTTMPEANGGSVVIESSQDIAVESIITSSYSDKNDAGAAGNIELIAASGDVVVNGNLEATSRAEINNAQSGGDIFIAASDNISIENISTVSTVGKNNSGRGGSVTLIGGEDIEVQDIDTRSTAEQNENRIGGAVLLFSEEGISAGAIATSGGNVDISASENIEIDFVDASGGDNSTPTSIRLSTQEDLRITSTISGRLREMSLSTVGTVGGDVFLEYGEDSEEFFSVGGDTEDSSAIGGIETPSVEIITGSFPNNASFGNIIFRRAGLPGGMPKPEVPTTETEQIELPTGIDRQVLGRRASTRQITEVSSNALGREPLALLGRTNRRSRRTQDEAEGDSVSSARNALFTNFESADIEIVLEQAEANISQGFQTYLGVSKIEEQQPATIEEIQRQLLEIEEETGEKPAVVYAYFTPSTTELSSDSSGHKDNTKMASPLSANPDDELEIMVITSGRQPVRQRQRGVTREQVERVGFELREQITSPFSSSQQYLTPAQQMHSFLISPISQVLEEEGVGSLGFILEAGLRALPLAAIHSGEQYLVEKYSLGLLPSFSLTDFSSDRTRISNSSTSRVLAMGASDFENQPDLPAVEAEIELITKEIWRGDAFLNEAFDLETIQMQLQKKEHDVFHLATHAVFQAEDKDNSYIQLWNDQLALSEIDKLQLSESDIRMIILSACNTAMGDDASEYGFAGFTVQTGIPSALASLWPISDEGTLGFMTQFYQSLDAAPVRAEALRRAQLNMIKGDVGIRYGEIYGPGDQVLTTIPELAESGQWDFSHPFYWSPFTMIGSPW